MAVNTNGDGDGSLRGTIRRLVRDEETGKLKGFGFIVDGEGTQYFFHRHALRNVRIENLREGQTVWFLPIQGERGPRADRLWLE